MVSTDGSLTANGLITPLDNSIAPIINLQGPVNTPKPTALDVATNPILPARVAASQFSHFPDNLYDLSSTSHLYRFLMAILGDSGVGQLTKRYQLSLLQADIAGTHFFDLDRFYGALFGFRRLSSEQLKSDPMAQTLKTADWADVMAKDASYRSRIIDFSKGIALGATYPGLTAVAHSIISAEVEIYESWMLYDDQSYTTGGSPVQIGQRTWGDVERLFPTYGNLEGQTYGSLEGGLGTFSNPLGSVRNQFTIQPHRPISLEETYEMQRVLKRLKPADQIMVVDAGGLQMLKPVTGMKVAADSSYWEVSINVIPSPTTISGAASPYQVTNNPGTSQVQPQPPFSSYQGESWSYNADIAAVATYSERAPGIAINNSDFSRQFFSDGTHVDHTGNNAVMSAKQLAAGRMVTDGLLVASPYAGVRK
jgi:hypothetical protein